MAHKLREYFNLIKEAGNEFIDDDALKLSASLAYYTVFSIGPLLLVVVTLMGFFYQKGEITTELFEQLSTLVGHQGSMQLKSILDNTNSLGKNTTTFGIIGLVVLIFGATGIFTEIQGSVNYIWSIKAKPQKGWLKYITDRLLSFSLIIGVGFLLLVTLMIDLLVEIVMKRMQIYLGDGYVILINGVNVLLLFSIVTFLFTVIYKVLPDATIYWKDAFAGAFFSGILFLIGKFLISYYLGSSTTINTYGAAASIIIILSWVYYSSIILYYGAEYTKVYATRLGRGIKVYETAVYIIKRESKELPGSMHPAAENNSPAN